MEHDIDALLRHEELQIEPVQGRFDLPTLKARLLALEGTWNDPNREQVFLIFATAAERTQFLETHVPSTATEYSYPIVPVVELRPERVYVNLFAGESFNPLTRPFIEALLAGQACSVS